MTIDEKYANAIQMLYSCYDGKNENLSIPNSVFQDIGLGDEFKSVLWPRLVKEGILRELPPLIFGGDLKDPVRYNLLTDRTNKLLDDIAELQKQEYGSGRYAADSPIPPSSLLKEKMSEQNEILNEIGSCFQSNFAFVVDGKKLDVAYKKYQAKLSAAERGGRSATETEPQQRNKLNFYPESGEMEFAGEIGVAKNGDKDHALLTLFHRSKNTPFSVEDIQGKCNELIGNESHKFKGEKDIDDTVRQIRFKLKVNKGAFFPIIKKKISQKKCWVLIDK